MKTAGVREERRRRFIPVYTDLSKASLTILYIVKLVSFRFNSLNVTKVNKLGRSYKPRDLDNSQYMSFTPLMKFTIMIVQNLLNFFYYSSIFWH